MDVTIVNQPDLRIAGIRHIGPYQQIGRSSDASAACSRARRRPARR